jgi:hypothetical protein
VAGPTISLSASGKFSKTSAYLNKLKQNRILTILNQYGPRGVEALKAATPVESGETAAGWYYTTGQQNGQYYLDFHNSHVEDGQVIAILIQYGHGTRTGGYVIGRDFINPVVQPLFDEIAKTVFEEVTKV